MAVQILAYEVRIAWLATQEEGKEAVVVEDQTQYPSADDLERFYVHLEQVLLKTGFIRTSHPGQIMSKLRRLYNRARPETQELNILRGMLSSIDNEKKSGK